MGIHIESPLTHIKTSCALCQSLRSFEIPDGLLERLQEGNVVVFAGAGISTESRNVFPVTFYETIRDQLNIDRDADISFPALMSMFCQAKGRADLIRQIQSRLDYVSSFPELHIQATAFHQTLSSLFYVNTIITTNWDDYFEEVCGARPLTTAEDFAFWSLPERKVYKIHGSAKNVGSIIATDEDYKRAHSELEKGALGSALKLALSTKTILYVGYSLRDHDFLEIHNYLRAELGEFAPISYIVSLDDSSEQRFRQAGLRPIFTDARFFVAMLKKHLEGNDEFIPDERFAGIMKAWRHVKELHGELHVALRPAKHPTVIYTACYQDGLMHAFERMMARIATGEYAHRCVVDRQVSQYLNLRREKVKAKLYQDVAYIDGYIEGLLYLLANDEERKQLDVYYLFGERDHPKSLKETKRRVLAGSNHKGAVALAKRLVKGLSDNDDFHHRPFL
jgi:hypothetical protein